MKNILAKPSWAILVDSCNVMDGKDCTTVKASDQIKDHVLAPNVDSQDLAPVLWHGLSA